MKHEAIAHVAHEANRALQLELGDPAPSPHWEEAPDWQRESAIEGVKRTLEGQAPPELHESWCEFKLKDGWVYGDVKDAEKKTHPCLVDYDELPLDQRVKDDLFFQIVWSLEYLDD